MVKFQVDKAKAVEALVYAVQRAGQVTRFEAAKIVYFADLEHLKTFGRPITGDYYVAMDNGPVPSFIYDVLKGTEAQQDKVFTNGALKKVAAWHPTYAAERDPDLSLLSRTDQEALDQAVKHVMGRSFGSVSDETHQHRAWKRAPLNGSMSFDDMLDGADQEILEEAEYSAAYAVL